MENIEVICSVLGAFFCFVLICFAVFAIGFIIGYKYEEKRIIKKTIRIVDSDIKESEEEKRAKREWKNFLKYDGSVIGENMGL